MVPCRFWWAASRDMTAKDSRRCCGWKGLRMLLVVVVVLVPEVLVIGIRPPRNEEEEEDAGAMDALRRGAPPMLGRMAGGSMLWLAKET